MSVKGFIALFQKEFQQYSLLEEKARLKYQAIIDNDITKLLTIVTEEQAVLRLIEDLEEERACYLKNLAQEKGLGEQIISFTELLTFLPEEKSELNKLRQEFVDLLSSLQQLNEQNRQMIEASLQINDLSQEMIKELVEQGEISSAQKNKDKQSEHIVDKKA